MLDNSNIQSRFYYLDILRIISCFLIVCVHVSGLNWNDIPVNSSQWQVMNLFDCIGILGVPIFFMISGALFLQSNSNLSITKLYSKNILRLFIIYHFWLLFYNMLPFFHGKTTLTIDTIKYELLDSFLCGKGIYHLWFIPEIIVLYMLSPILKEAFQKKDICKYFLILFAIFGTFLPMVLQYFFPYRKYIASYYERTSLTMMTGYIGYFVLGHYLHTFEFDLTSKKKRSFFWITILICNFVTIFACSIDALSKNTPSTILNTPFSLVSFIACFNIFLLCKYYFNNSFICHHSWITKLSSLTFGIYLLHPYMLELLTYLKISTLQPHPLIMIPILIVIISVMCMIPIFLLKKIPFINKWLL